MSSLFIGKAGSRVFSRAMSQSVRVRATPSATKPSDKRPSPPTAGIHWSIYAGGLAALVLGGYYLSSEDRHGASLGGGVAAPGVTLVGPKRRVVKADEIAKHKTVEKGLWVAIDGRVVDVSRYLEENQHPIGPKPILAHAGQDITVVFNKLHKPGTLDNVLKGDLVTEVGVVDPAFPPPEPAPWVKPAEKK